MYGPVPERLARPGQILLQLGVLPPEHVEGDEHDVALEVVDDDLLVQQANLLPLGVGGPAADGQLEPVVPDALEAGLLEPGDVAAAVDDAEGLAQLLAARDEGVTPGVEGGVVRDGVVVRGDADVVVEMLEPAAGLEAAVDLSIEGVPVADGAHEAAYVYEVKVVVRVRPGELGVVELKVTVWGYLFSLIRRVSDTVLISCGEKQSVGFCLPRLVVWETSLCL